MGAELHVSGSTAKRPPPGKIALYGEFFTTGNFCLPITKFVSRFLTLTWIHISQMHPFWLMRLRHFEFCCQALREAPSIERFCAIYKLQARGSWFICAVVKKPIGTEPSCSTHDWKNKFFWINKDVMPNIMVHRSLTDKFTDLTVADSGISYGMIT